MKTKKMIKTAKLELGYKLSDMQLDGEIHSVKDVKVKKTVVDGNDVTFKLLDKRSGNKFKVQIKNVDVTIKQLKTLSPYELMDLFPSVSAVA